jgi:TolB-like protein/class 3 adenylate cyclase/tetratricopeptide (TPR) repeat protein
MAKDRLSGKLAVILHADVTGSTQLVQQDEQLAHERIQDAFRRFSDTIERYHGRVQELRGDALLAEFERASDAVSAALSFQSSHHDHLDKYKDDIQPEIRVGIALGEVVIADSTVTGAGVVLAQRVEQLAEPGGLCITSAIHEALPNRMPFSIESLGGQALKGFEEHVRVYRVQLSAGESVPSPQQKSHRQASPGNWRQMTLISVVVVLVAVAIGYWFKSSLPQEEPASVERMAFPLPDKPSIAVLPFNNISDDPKQEYFADGMTEDLITDLSKISGLFVIARNSSFSYKGQQVKVRQVAEDLGVRYVLEGSVRRAGDQVRINAQLIDATTGGHLWAERYDGSLTDVFALQDQVTEQIMEAMSVTLTQQELEDLGSTGTSNTEAHDAYLQGLSFYFRSTPADNAKAEAHFVRAIGFDPEFKRAYTALAKVYYKGREWEYAFALGTWWRKNVFRAHRILAKSNAENIADANVVRSQMALYKHQLDIALREADRALALNTNDVDALKARARALIYSGEYAEGRKLAYQVMRLDPANIAEPLYLIGIAYFAAGSYEKAADHIEQAIENDPSTAIYVRLLAATYGKLGMSDEANKAWLKYRKSWKRNHGQFWIAAAVQFYPFQDREILTHLADGFEAAGGVERPPSRFLKLDARTRLSGEEIRALMFGRSIEGRDYWLGDSWLQNRTLDGRVTSKEVGTTRTAVESVGEVEITGDSWIDGDRLCDRWPEAEVDLTICVTIFRDLDSGQNSYYMVTDTGPHPFSVVN